MKFLEYILRKVITLTRHIEGSGETKTASKQPNQFARMDSIVRTKRNGKKSNVT